jgi:hypothetical protein
VRTSNSEQVKIGYYPTLQIEQELQDEQVGTAPSSCLYAMQGSTEKNSGVLIKKERRSASSVFGNKYQGKESRKIMWPRV